MKPSLSLVYMTYRPGGMDMLRTSLERQTRTDYELIVIDDYPGRVGRGRAEAYIRKAGIPLSVFRGSKHKSYPETLCGLVNAMNTALLHVRAPLVVFMHDFMLVEENAVQNWVATFDTATKQYGERLLVSGGAIVYESDPPDMEDDITVWEKPVQIVPKWPWTPCHFECFYFGGPTEVLLGLNGFDERADHNVTWVINSIVAQAKAAGMSLAVDPTNLVCHLIDHRRWEGPAEEGKPMGTWRIWGEYSTCPDAPEWSAPSPNPFDVRTLRKETLRD